MISACDDNDIYLTERSDLVVVVAVAAVAAGRCDVDAGRLAATV